MKEHKIISVAPGSIAQEMELKAGDYLLSINGHEVKDILDYRWHMTEEFLLVDVRKPCGEVWALEIEKDADDDLGITFAAGSLGEDRRCVNKCIFCFVDQQPPGLRESLYVKDDDPYQSFALGNYITLTNLGEEEIGQIIKYKLSPMRISVHTVNFKLRRKMLHSIRAGNLLSVLERFAAAGIDMHFQVVLCKGINDGAELDKTIERLLRLGDRAKSLAIVPVGLTRYREGLYPLEGFGANDAAAVIAQVEGWQARIQEGIGAAGMCDADLSARGDNRFVFAADEWYVLAGIPLPQYEDYDDFPQLDNGVGMMALFEAEFLEALSDVHEGELETDPMVAIREGASSRQKQTHIGIVTGQAAGAFMDKLLRRFTQSFPDITIDIHVIRNDFYGHGVTVSGLITGQDIIAQLQGHCNGLDTLFVPENAFRAGSEDMLCGATLGDVAEALGVDVIKGAIDGGEFCRQLKNCLEL